MNAIKLHSHDAQPPPLRHRVDWFAPASRVFLGLCLLAGGWMAWQGGQDVMRAASAGRSAAELEAVRREEAARLLRLSAKLDDLERRAKRDTD